MHTDWNFLPISFRISRIQYQITLWNLPSKATVVVVVCFSQGVLCYILSVYSVWNCLSGSWRVTVNPYSGQYVFTVRFCFIVHICQKLVYTLKFFLLISVNCLLYLTRLAEALSHFLPLHFFPFFIKLCTVNLVVFPIPDFRLWSDFSTHGRRTHDPTLTASHTSCLPISFLSLSNLTSAIQNKTPFTKSTRVPTYTSASPTSHPTQTLSPNQVWHPRWTSPTSTHSHYRLHFLLFGIVSPLHRWILVCAPPSFWPILMTPLVRNDVYTLNSAFLIVHRNPPVVLRQFWLIYTLPPWNSIPSVTCFIYSLLTDYIYHASFPHHF